MSADAVSGVAVAREVSYAPQDCGDWEVGVSSPTLWAQIGRVCFVCLENRKLWKINLSVSAVRKDRSEKE